MTPVHTHPSAPNAKGLETLKLDRMTRKRQATHPQEQGRGCPILFAPFAKRVGEPVGYSEAGVTLAKSVSRSDGWAIRPCTETISPQFDIVSGIVGSKFVAQLTVSLAMAAKSNPGKIHLRIIEVMKRFPQGISGGQIRQELEREGLEPGGQTHLDRRKRDLKKWFVIQKVLAKIIVAARKGMSHSTSTLA